MHVHVHKRRVKAPVHKPCQIYLQEQAVLGGSGCEGEVTVGGAVAKSNWDHESSPLSDQYINTYQIIK